MGVPRDARDVRIAPHYRSRSRLSISGGSGCADGFLVGVPFTLQWPPMAFYSNPIPAMRLFKTCRRFGSNYDLSEPDASFLIAFAVMPLVVLESVMEQSDLCPKLLSLLRRAL